MFPILHFVSFYVRSDSAFYLCMVMEFSCDSVGANLVAGPCTFVVNAADLGLRVSHTAWALPFV